MQPSRGAPAGREQPSNGDFHLEGAVDNLYPLLPSYSPSPARETVRPEIVRAIWRALEARPIQAHTAADTVGLIADEAVKLWPSPTPAAAPSGEAPGQLKAEEQVPASDLRAIRSLVATSIDLRHWDDDRAMILREIDKVLASASAAPTPGTVEPYCAVHTFVPLPKCECCNPAARRAAPEGTSNG